MKSPCTSNKHSEYTCLIKWGVSSKKFKPEKWCDGCIEHYSHTHLVQEYLSEAENKVDVKDKKRGVKRKKE